MSREVRRVPAGWQHPKYTVETAPHPAAAGRYIPLHESRGYADAAADWDEGFMQWGLGFVRNYDDDSKWIAKGPEHDGRYTEWEGPRPSPDDYMPDWPDDACTHLMMYETTSEGTPLSPAFKTAEELAHWLADNGASAFGSDTATYRQWLAMIGKGWAMSMVIDNGVMKSGVEFAAEKP